MSLVCLLISTLAGGGAFAVGAGVAASSMASFFARFAAFCSAFFSFFCRFFSLFFSSLFFSPSALLTESEPSGAPRHAYRVRPRQ